MAIRWAVRLGQDGKKLDMNTRAISLKEAEQQWIHVSIDEEWLYELKPGPTTPNTSIPTLEPKDRQNETSEEDKEDTLKAATPHRQTAILAKEIPTHPQSPGQARLSGLFQAWVDTRQHPAPPPTPQLTLVGSESTALAGLLSEGIEDQLAISPRSVYFEGTPEKAPVSVSACTVTIELSMQEQSADRSTPTKASSRRYSLIPNLAFANPSSPRTPTARPFISLSTASGSSFTRLLAQSTGESETSTLSQDTWGSRFGLGAWVGGTPTKSPQIDQGSIRSVDGASLSGSVKPLEKQVTGGLWGWWTGVNKAEEGSAEAYIEGLRVE